MQIFTHLILVHTHVAVPNGIFAINVAKLRNYMRLLYWSDFDVFCTAFHCRYNTSFILQIFCECDSWLGHSKKINKFATVKGHEMRLGCMNACVNGWYSGTA